MGNRLLIAEILAKLSEFTGANSTKAKIAWLQKNDSGTLRLILRHAFDSGIVYKLPDGEPPYTKNDSPAGLTENSLFAETRRLNYLFHNPPPGLKRHQLEGLFISMIEGLHASEAIVILAVKDKRLHRIYPELTEDLVNAAFPNLLPPPPAKL
jgi:hypothetical protein